MSPLLMPGDEVLINPGAFRQDLPCVGDIVVARHPYITDQKIVKRIVAITEDGRCHLQGENSDSLESSDSRSFGAVPPKLLLGRVTSRLSETTKP